VYSDQASSHASILRRIAARLKKAEDDLAAVVEVYSDPASSLSTRLHNHPAPQDVVLSSMHETGGKPHFPTLIDLDILDPESGLPRIPLPGTSVNKGRKKEHRLTQVV
jgi:hypothetical protein